MTDPVPNELRTARLVLRPMTRALARDIVAGRRRPDWAMGFPQAGDRTIARLWSVGRPPGEGWTVQSEPPWGPYEIWTILGQCIGTAGFHGPPVDGQVEIGYGIAAGQRGRGLATEAVSALLDVARRHQVARVVAHVDADNITSQRVLARLGFQPVDVAAGDAEEILLALVLPH